MVTDISVVQVNKMLVYFEKQLRDVATSLNKQSAKAMVEVRVANGGDEAKLTEYFDSKIGQHIVYAMVETNKVVEVKRFFESEIESALQGYTFDGMSGATPRFKNNR